MVDSLTSKFDELNYEPLKKEVQAMLKENNQLKTYVKELEKRILNLRMEIRSEVDTVDDGHDKSHLKATLEADDIARDKSAPDDPCGLHSCPHSDCYECQQKRRK